MHHRVVVHVDVGLRVFAAVVRGFGAVGGRADEQVVRHVAGGARLDVKALAAGFTTFFKRVAHYLNAAAHHPNRVVGTTVHPRIFHDKGSQGILEENRIGILVISNTGRHGRHHYGTAAELDVRPLQHH